MADPLESRRFILASASPRRRELLALLGLSFEVHISRVDEDSAPAGTPRDLALNLAYEKAWDLFNQIRFGEIATVERNVILAADTVVAIDNQVLAKPCDADDARRMIRLLSGRTHEVYTAVCLMEADWHESEDDWIPTWNLEAPCTRVTFRELTGAMIEAYVVTRDPFDKAGAYGIQGFASSFVAGIEGDYFNVVGLPVATVAAMLERIGIEWWRGQAKGVENGALSQQPEPRTPNPEP